MFRLFLLRILNGKNPFHADIDHIHHLITKRVSSFLCIFNYIPSNFIKYFSLLYFYKFTVIIINYYFIIFVLFFILKKERQKIETNF